MLTVFELLGAGRAAYAVALLHDGLGIGLDDSSLMFTDKITSPSGESVILDWTLGTFHSFVPFPWPL